MTNKGELTMGEDAKKIKINEKETGRWRRIDASTFNPCLIKENPPVSGELK